MIRRAASGRLTRMADCKALEGSVTTSFTKASSKTMCIMAGEDISVPKASTGATSQTDSVMDKVSGSALMATLAKAIGSMAR